MPWEKIDETESEQAPRGKWSEVQPAPPSPFWRGVQQGAAGIAGAPGMLVDIGTQALSGGRFDPNLRRFNPVEAMAGPAPPSPPPGEMSLGERQAEAAGRAMPAAIFGPTSFAGALASEALGAEVRERTGSELAGAGAAFGGDIAASLLARRPAGRLAARAGRYAGTLTPEGAAAARLEDLGGPVGRYGAEDVVEGLQRRQDELTAARRAAYAESDPLIEALPDTPVRQPPPISAETALQAADEAIEAIPAAGRAVGTIEAAPFVEASRRLLDELADVPEDIPTIARNWAQKDPQSTVSLKQIQKMLRSLSSVQRKARDNQEAAAKAYHASKLQDIVREMLDSIPFDYDAAGNVVDMQAYEAVEALKRSLRASAVEHGTFRGPIQDIALSERGYNPQMAMSKILSRGKKENVAAARTMMRELSDNPEGRSGLRRAAMERIFEGRIGSGIQDPQEVFSARSVQSARNRLNQNTEIFEEILGKGTVERMRRALTLSANDKPSRGFRALTGRLARGGGAAGGAITGDLTTAAGVHIASNVIDWIAARISPRHWQQLAYAGLFDEKIASNLMQSVSPTNAKNVAARALATAIRKGHVEQAAWEEFQEAQ